MKRLLYQLILIMSLSSSLTSVVLAQGYPMISNVMISSTSVAQNSTVTYSLRFQINGFESVPHQYNDGGVQKSSYLITIDLPTGKEIIPVVAAPSVDLIVDPSGYFVWTYDEANNQFYGKPTRLLEVDNFTDIKITLKGMVQSTTGYVINTNLQTPGLINTPSGQLPITLKVDQPLPVTLTHFTANKEQSTTELVWATSDEVGSDRFVIQRSFDHKDWHDLGTVYAAGNSKTERQYNFVDQSPLNGENYYRLKMIDRDGSYEMSRIASVVFDNLSTIAVYPNPTTEAVRVVSREKQPISKLVLQGTAGEHILTRTSDLEKQIDLKSMPGGTYILQIHHTDGQISSHKIIKL